MPRHRETQCISPADRRREVASILARGVIRWRRKARTVGDLDAQESSPGRGIGLELFRETRLSVVDRTRGLRLRDVGDNT